MTTTGTKAEREVRLDSSWKDRASNHLMQGASRNLLRTPAYFGSAIIAASMLAAGFAPSANAQGTFKFTSGLNLDYNTTTNWSSNAVPYGRDAIANFQNPTATESVTTGATLDIVGTINEKDGGSSVLTLSSSGSGGFNFSSSAGNATFTVSGAGTAINLLNASSTLTSTLDVTISNTSVTSVTGALQFNGALAGGGGFIKDGDGTASFASAAKNYTGSTVINAGILRTSLEGIANATSSVTVASGGTLSLAPTVANQTLQFGASANIAITLNGTGATKLMGNTVAAIGALALTGLSTTLSNNIVLASDSQISPTNTLVLTLAGTVSGGGGLTVLGDARSTLALSVANSYTGNTNVNGGTLLISTGSINTSSTVTVGTGGTLTLQNATALADAGSLFLEKSSTLNLNAPGGTEVIENLFLEGKSVAPGIYTADLLSKMDGSVGYSGDFETLTVTGVPEPATIFGGALMVGAFAWNQHRRLVALAVT